MEKAQWSPINSEPMNTGSNPAAKKPQPALARLPINFPNGTPVRAKKQYAEPPKRPLERPPVVSSPTERWNLPAPEVESRPSRPRDVSLPNHFTMERPGSSTSFTTISPDERTSERRVEAKRHEMGPNGRNTASIPSSRAGTQTPKIDQQAGASTMTERTQLQKPDPVQTARKVYQAFNIPPPGNDLNVSERQPNATKMSEPRQGSVKRTPGPRDTPASVTKESPNGHSLEPQEGQNKPVQDHQPIEIDDQSSSSSDDEAANVATGAGRKADEAIEEAGSPVIDESDHVTTMTGLPDDHPVEWLAEAREFYQSSLPPFVTKQKFGVRRMVELPLLEGQQHAGKVEVVYRSWDAVHTFASIDVDGKRFIVKVFRGGATPYRPWLGPRTGFSETALAFSKQVPRGSKSWSIAQGKRVYLPKGWALKEDDERDDDYSPANRRKSSTVRRRQNLNYDLNEDEEELDEDPYQEDPLPRSGRSSVEREYAAPDSTGDQPLDSNVSATQPPSQLINALTKSLRLPKKQEVFQRPKQIKRKSIGGQGAPTGSGGIKRQKHKAVFSSDSDHSVSHKRAKSTNAIPHRTNSTNAADSAHIYQGSNHEPPTFDPPALSPYKQAHTTLRIALVPYPQQFAIHRLRSCMTIATFFSTVVGVSGYKGDKNRIFGISATFDCKSDDAADRSMVIREEWQDSFEVFLETVDGAESWTEEGGKCGVAVSLLLTKT